MFTLEIFRMNFFHPVRKIVFFLFDMDNRIGFFFNDFVKKM